MTSFSTARQTTRKLYTFQLEEHFDNGNNSGETIPAERQQFAVLKNKKANSDWFFVFSLCFEQFNYDY